MKKIGACLMLAATLTAAFAQTNPPPGRAMSLQDCFAAALTNNLDVRIERYNPLISEYNLSASYGGYDPQFTLGGTHGSSDFGAYPQNGGPLSPTIDYNNSFDSGLIGTLPWGTDYSLLGKTGQDHNRSYNEILGANFFTDSSSSSVEVDLTQPLLKNFWIDSTRLQILVNKNRLKYSEQGLRNQLIQTVTAVEDAYYELIFAIENVKVQEVALNLAETQLNQDRQRVQVGSLAPLDVQQDEAQAAQSRANLITAQKTLSVDQNTLKNLLTDNYAQWHDQDIQPSDNLDITRQLLDVQDSWSKGMSSRPDLLQARLDLEQQGFQLKYYRNQLYPELDLKGTYRLGGAGYRYNQSFGQVNDGSRPYYSYGGRLTIPLSNAKARNNLKAGKATEKQLLLSLKRLEQQAMVDIDNAVKTAQSAWESVEATKQARIYAQAALEAEQKKYAVGKSTTFTVLQLQNNLTSARSQEIRAQADYKKSLADLAQQEGSTLQRRNLTIDYK